MLPTNKVLGRREEFQRGYAYSYGAVFFNSDVPRMF